MISMIEHEAINVSALLASSSRAGSEDFLLEETPTLKENNSESEKINVLTFLLILHFVISITFKLLLLHH